MVAEEDVLVIIPNDATVDGSGSTDPEEDPLSFEWKITSAPAGSSAAIGNPTMEIAGLTPDEEGVYEVLLTVSDLIVPGEPATVTITATTAQNFAEERIVLADQIVADLSQGDVTTGGNQKAFRNFLKQAVVALQADDVVEAIDKLEKAIERADGCAERDNVDGNGNGRDWITSCAKQIAVNDYLNEALTVLKPPVN